MGGATVDLARTAPQWTTTQDEHGHSSFKFAKIDIVVTILGSDELMTRRRSPSSLVHAAAADSGDRETTIKLGNRKDIGSDTVKPVSYTLGGRRHGKFCKNPRDESGGSEEERYEHSCSA